MREKIPFRDAVEFTFKLIERIESYWDFFALTNLGVVAWLFTRENSLNTLHSVIATLAYLFLIYIKCAALLRSYVLLRDAVDELKKSAEYIEFKSSGLERRIKKLSYKYRLSMVLIVHSLTFIVVIFLIWRDQV